jgi:hypothetical protein
MVLLVLKAKLLEEVLLVVVVVNQLLEWLREVEVQQEQ